MFANFHKFIHFLFEILFYFRKYKFYISGLGTSTSKEAKEYFADMEKHRITFKYSGAEDDAAITLVSLMQQCVSSHGPRCQKRNLMINATVSHKTAILEKHDHILGSKWFSL